MSARSLTGKRRRANLIMAAHRNRRSSSGQRALPLCFSHISAPPCQGKGSRSTCPLNQFQLCVNAALRRHAVCIRGMVSSVMMEAVALAAVGAAGQSDFPCRQRRSSGHSRLRWGGCPSPMALTMSVPNENLDPSKLHVLHFAFTQFVLDHDMKYRL